jgi:hypothetical protein
MKHQPRLSRRQSLTLQGLYAEMFAGSLEYNDQHLGMLRRRRDAYLRSLKQG